MALDVQAMPEWLATVLLARDDTEESVVGADLHQEAIGEAHGPLFAYAEDLGEEGAPAWYVSQQVTILVRLPRRTALWRPKPDVFVVPGIPAHSRSSYDTRTEGPMPPFVLEVASESTWRYDVDEKATLYQLAGVREYLVFDPTQDYLRASLRGWRLRDGVWQRWAPVTRADGVEVWESAVLGLAVRAEGLLVRFDHPERGPLPVRRELRARQAAAEARAAQERAEREAADARAVAAEARAAAMQRALEEAQAEIARLRAQREDHP